MEEKKLAIEIEPHFTPGEIGKATKLHPATVRRLFQDEPGVVRIGRLVGRGRKRPYVTLRIPASVAARVLERLAR